MKVPNCICCGIFSCNCLCSGTLICILFAVEFPIVFVSVAIVSAEEILLANGFSMGLAFVIVSAVELWFEILIWLWNFQFQLFYTMEHWFETGFAAKLVSENSTAKTSTENASS